MKHLSIRAILARHRPALTLLFSGGVGLLASFTLTLDKLKLEENADFVPACSLNPIITCSSAIGSAQSMLVGIPLSMLGIGVFTGLVVVAGLLLMGVNYPKRISVLIVVASFGGFLFVNYLIIQSILVLHVICPWCLTIWLTTPLTLLAAVQNYARQYAAPKLAAYLPLGVGVWYACLFLLVVYVFRDYWVTLLPAGDSFM